MNAIIRNAFSLLVRYRYGLRRNITFGKNVYFRGAPLIEIVDGGRLQIGNNVTINSLNRRYHLNMYSRVKLFAEGKDAHIRIGDNTRIHGTCIHARTSVIIGKNCLVAANCQIVDSSGHDVDLGIPSLRIFSKGHSHPIEIKDNVWIGANVIIMPGVTIGEGSVVGAGSIVTRDVPEMVLAAGNPAKAIRRIKKATFTDPNIELLPKGV